MARSDEEFAEFVALRWSRLYRFAFVLTREHASAEDLVQTALAKVYVAWPRLVDLGAAQSYAMTTLANTNRSALRRRIKELPYDVMPEIPVMEGGEEDTDALLRALMALPHRQRAVVVLRFYEDLSVEQTAEVLRCATGTVKSQTHDALANLRTSLGEELAGGVR